MATRPAAARGGFGLSVTQAETLLLRLARVLTLFPEGEATYREWVRLVTIHRVPGVGVHGVGPILSLDRKDFARYPDVAVLHPVAVVGGSGRPGRSR